MKCPSCKNLFVIRTDPKSGDYIFISGIKKLYSEYLASKKKEKAEMAEKAAARMDMSLNEKVKMIDNKISIARKTNLRYSNIDLGPQSKDLELLKEDKDESSKNDFDLNQKARAIYR
jgi:hypothetical protein